MTLLMQWIKENWIIKEKKNLSAPICSLFIIYTNRCRQMQLKITQNYIFPICCQIFSFSPSFSRDLLKSNQCAKVVCSVSFTHFALMHAKPHFAQFQQKLVIQQPWSWRSWKTKQLPGPTSATFLRLCPTAEISLQVRRGNVHSVWPTGMQNKTKAIYWHLWSIQQRSDLT